MVATRTDGPEERHRAILELLMQRPSISITELVEITGRSLMTVHRDIDALVARGMVRKYRGGVSALPTSVFEASVDFRLLRQVGHKKALARAARDLVEPGMSVMLDDSTTVHTLARTLTGVGPITVITNFRPTIDLFVGEPDVRLICLGGQYSASHDSYIAPADQSGLSSYAVDVVFQSTSTMDAEMTYHQERDVVVMKRPMLEVATRRVLMMDATKVGHSSLHRFVPVAAFTDCILTSDVPLELQRAIGERTNVHVVPV